MNPKIIILVVGASIVTFFMSVVFSINMVLIKPRNLAEVIKKDPATFMDAVQTAAKNYQKVSAEQKLEEQFKNPATIKTKGRVTFGNIKAPISIVEFSDFQCPYCAKASLRMKKLIKKYDGKVNLVYKHFPLNFHPLAKPAAEYFEAIALISHKKAKNFHDGIFEDFENYGRVKNEKEVLKKLNTLVKKVGLKLSDIQKNLPDAKKIVEKDLKEAEVLGVGGTPSFFVNGVDTKGFNPEVIIEKLLKKL